MPHIPRLVFDSTSSGLPSFRGGRIFCLVAGAALAILLASGFLPATEIVGKVDPILAYQLDKGGPVDFLVMLAEQTDLSLAACIPDKTARGRWVYEQLAFTARHSQAALVERLARLGVSFRPYWIANVVWVQAGAEVVRELAARDDVAFLYADPKIKMAIPCPTCIAKEQATAVEWNITKVRAPEVWALGFRGAGVVVGGSDTGYDWTHPALQGKYRGWNGVAGDHNYNWHDAIHATGSSCGADSLVPCDDYGHGTHTMGTMVGESGANQIGMAPDAKWIGCRNMNNGVGSPSTYIECLQWFIAPTDLQGNNPDPSKAPDVINNSWGCPPSEGCTDPNVLRQAVANVRAAGIVVVASAGNSGSSCSTVSDPIAIYDESFTVGNTTSTDAISGSSSRGPVTIDGSNRLKPDVSAPGTSIRSAYPGGSYTSMSGTSMAGPHVVGLVALMLSAAPALRGNVSALETAIALTAVPLTSTQSCGGVPGTQIPNNTFGYGRIDALAAVQAVMSPGPIITAHPQSRAVCSGQTVTLTVTASGTGTLHYAWFRGATGDASHPVGSDASSFTTPAVTATVAYWVKVTDDVGSTNSQAATVQPVSPIQLGDSPADVRIPRKTNTTLTVSPSGGGPFQFHWYQGFSGDTTTPVGANAASFTTPVLLADARYWVRVANTCGEADSRTALVRVFNSGADLNRDGVINEIDLLLEARFLAGDETALPCGPTCADVNGDHQVDVLDLLAVVKETME